MDVVDDVIRFVVWSVGSVCKVERQVEVVNDFHVALDDNLEAVFFKDFLEIFFDLFCLWAAQVLKSSESIVSIKSNGSLVVPVRDDR